jgi:hypothetical protein
MGKKIVLTIIIGLFLSIFISSINATFTNIINENNFEQISEMIIYKDILYKKAESMFIQAETISNDDINFSLLWKNYDDVGISYGMSVFCSDVNGDGMHEVLVNHSVLNGKTGELIWNTSTGEICGVGDINFDGTDEVFTRYNSLEVHEYSYLYCLNGENGSILWQISFNCTIINNIEVGNFFNNNLKNEVIVPTRDWIWRNNQYVFCLNGLTGDIIWEKFTSEAPMFAKIADVNNDGNNEVIVVDWVGHLLCLDKYGNFVWENLEGSWCRDICIGNLNQDPYKEIIFVSGCPEISCISGYNGSTLWNWTHEPDGGMTGSIQSLNIADMIPSVPGNEVIVGDVCGVYCLNGEDNVDPNERQLWHAGISNGQLPNTVASTDVGDLDKDGLLDVAAITVNFPPISYGIVYGIDGQLGTRLWKYDNCGNFVSDTIRIADINCDNILDVIAKDDSFVCALIMNTPPNTPTINGPTNGKVNVEYSYTISTIDPDDDQVYFYINWGDDTNTGWIGPYISGELVTVKHTWTNKGNFAIKCKAKDTYGIESYWTTLTVTIPKNKAINSPFQSLLKNYLHNVEIKSV